MSIVSRELILAIRRQYRLPWRGIHGVIHWARVRENGLRLAAITGARPAVVELFAVFHDACRLNDDRDPEHGVRAAALAAARRGQFFDLADDDFALLLEACRRHTGGTTGGDVTVTTCWDADRLDLARVGTTPESRYLSTPAAREAATIRWATERARDGFVPDIVAAEWAGEAERAAGRS